MKKVLFLFGNFFFTFLFFVQVSVFAKDTLLPGEKILPGQDIKSSNGKYRLIYQNDGNLVLYKSTGGEALWATNTNNTNPGQCIMQTDGNLVIYLSNGGVAWASDTNLPGFAGGYAKLTDIGFLEIYKQDKNLGWTIESKVNGYRFAMFMLADPQYPWVLEWKKPNWNGTKQIDKTDQEVRAESIQCMTAQANSVKEYSGHLGDKVKGVIINGDLTAFGRKSELDVVMGIYKTIPSPLFLGIGNHDYENCVDDTPQNASASYMVNYLFATTAWVGMTNPKNIDVMRNNNKISGSLSYSWDIGNIHFVQLNNHPGYEYKWEGTPDGGSKMEFDIKNSLAWLDKDLNEARKLGKGIVVNMHDIQSFDGTHPAAYETFCEIVKKYKVAAVFVGHIHDYFGKKDPIGDVKVFNCGAPFYNNYLTLHVLKDRLVVRKVTFGTSGNSQQGTAEEVTLFEGKESLGLTTITPPPTKIMDNEKLTFKNNQGLIVRVFVKYLDAGGNSFNEYLELPGLSPEKTIALPVGAKNINVKFFRAGPTGYAITYKKLIYADDPKVDYINLGTDRSYSFKLSISTYDAKIVWEATNI